MKSNHLRIFPALIVAFLISTANISAQKTLISFSTLYDGQVLHGFTTKSVYLNDIGKPTGARFIHQQTGFVLDLLQIESVPQTYIWVYTPPVSDKGEPHTQEHLLITKGNKGRELNTREGMSLTESNAFTSQLYTVYDFNTGGGENVFYTLFEKYLDALLYPDYTDEEVRREVRNWGVTQNVDSSLRLEEKGSVYNEMSTGMNNAGAVLMDSTLRLVFGKAHPLSFKSGGEPSGIRELTAQDISTFHADHYYLGNMGAITSFPKSMKLDDVLKKTNDILSGLEKPLQHTAHKKLLFPIPTPAQKGTISTISVPAENKQETGSMILAYPSSKKFDAKNDLLLNILLFSFAGDPRTNLYKIFVDSKTRKPGFNSEYVNAYVEKKRLLTVFFELGGIASENLSKEKAVWVRHQLVNELKKIASFKDHSPELAAFNQRAKLALKKLHRDLNDFVNSPPKFGGRGGSDWFDHLEDLNQMSSFKKPLVLNPVILEVQKLLAANTNIWTANLRKWQLTTVAPYVIVGKPEPAVRLNEANARKKRATDEVDRLKTVFKLDNDQQAILRYKSIYDSNTVMLAKSEMEHTIPFIKDPPLTLDDELTFRTSSLDNNIPLVTSIFDNITSGTIGLAMNLDAVPADKLVYLAMLPQLITRTGVMKNDKSVTYDQMLALQKQQIYWLDSYYSTNNLTNRVELVVEAAGNNLDESKYAIKWIHDLLWQPNWSIENLPRLRDLTDQYFSRIRTTMQQWDESWVQDPASAYRFQNNPLMLSTSSVLTRSFNVFRMKWMLKDAGNKEDSVAISGFLRSLAEADTDRDQLKKMLLVLKSSIEISSDSAGTNKLFADAFHRLPANAKILAAEAASDLEQLINDVPNASLSIDWKYLCETIQRDLSQTPGKTLADLNALLKGFLKTDRLRLFLIGSESTTQQLLTPLKQLLSFFNKQPSLRQHYELKNVINERLRDHTQYTETPTFVGLVNPNSTSGIFLNSVPLITYQDTSRNKFLMFLAAKLYGGHGKQSVYTKTIAEGLSNSNGARSSASSGLFTYYAAHTPELPQTLRFVIDQVKKSPIDSSLIDYAISLAVGEFRSAVDFIERGELIASDIADGITPEKVRRFKQSILKMHNEPELVNKVFQYKDSVYEKILPGYGIASSLVPGGNFFVTGPEKQMVAYEAYLKSVYGEKTTLFRLYPRDFWLVPPR